MTLQTACGSLGFSTGVRFAWAFPYFFTLTDGSAWLRMTTFFQHCDGNLRMMVFSPARMLSMADGLRFNSLGQSLHNVIKIIIMQVSSRSNFSAFDYVRSHECGTVERIFNISYRCDCRRWKAGEKGIWFCIMLRKPNFTISFESDDKLNYVCETPNLCAFNFFVCFCFGRNEMKCKLRAAHETNLLARRRLNTY